MEPLRTRLAAICRRFGVSALYVFGSRAEEVARVVEGLDVTSLHPESDADIGVVPGQGHCLDVRDKARLMADLEDLLDVPRVDLVVLPEASAFLAVDVIRGELLYDADPDGTARYELYVLRRAGDLLPYERHRREQVLTRVAS